MHKATPKTSKFQLQAVFHCQYVAIIHVSEHEDFEHRLIAYIYCSQLE